MANHGHARGDIAASNQCLMPPLFSVGQHREFSGRHHPWRLFRNDLRISDHKTRAAAVNRAWELYGLEKPVEQPRLDEVDADTLARLRAARDEAQGVRR
jgi:hypothetical protein